MIIYFERNGERGEEKRLEVSVEEFEVQRGKRYLTTFLTKNGEHTVRQEVSNEDREVTLRKAIAFFDSVKASLWPEESSEQLSMKSR